MNYTLFVCMNNDNIIKFTKQIIKYKKFMFKIGLEESSSCYVNDLLGIDFASFGHGIKIFLEDADHKASGILSALNNLQVYNENILYDTVKNIIVIRYYDTNIKEVENFFKEKLALNFDCACIKTFNISKINLNKYLVSIKRKNNFFEFNIYEEYLDSTILIRFEKNATMDLQQNLLSLMARDLKDFYYADRDITLSNAVFEILSIHKMKISTCESFTGGLVANKLISENMGASELIEEGYVTYSDAKKHIVLGVDDEILKNFTAVSAEVAFEMAVGLLDITKADIVIATTGYANHCDKNLNGLFFTAIGDKQAVNVYKHKYDGSRIDTIKYGVNVALFETIKKLRQNTLNNLDFVV